MTSMSSTRPVLTPLAVAPVLTPRPGTTRYRETGLGAREARVWCLHSPGLTRELPTGLH